LNKYRQRHKDWIGNAAKKKPDTTFGEISDDDDDDDDDEVSEAADDIYAEATKHRAGVIAKDKAARARKKKSRG
jgi:hypothetical protein